MNECLRVYNNGDEVLEHTEDADSWLDFNRRCRPGCALFVNGECKQTGYLSMDRCIAIGHRIKEE